MTDLHTKGDINRAKGHVIEGLGRLTGNKREQVRGKAKQVQGDVQEGLADIKDSTGRTSTD